MDNAKFDDNRFAGGPSDLCRSITCRSITCHLVDGRLPRGQLHLLQPLLSRLDHVLVVVSGAAVGGSCPRYSIRLDTTDCTIDVAGRYQYRSTTSTMAMLSRMNVCIGSESTR
jgi:hypothetical protein